MNAQNQDVNVDTTAIVHGSRMSVVGVGLRLA